MSIPWEEGASLALFFLRLMTGLIFICHGYPKFTGRGEGKVSRAHFAGTLKRIGVPFPFYSAIVIGGIEFFGGVMLFLGLWTRWVAIALLPVMIVAGAKNLIEKGFVGSADFPLSLLAMLVALIFLGGGAVSVGVFFGQP